jgi:hypothetical protein
MGEEQIVTDARARFEGGAPEGPTDPTTEQPEEGYKPTIADTLLGAGDEPVKNLSTTKKVNECCFAHEVQFVTVKGGVQLQCKVCGSEVEPANEGEDQSLADYNRK